MRKNKTKKTKQLGLAGESFQGSRVPLAGNDVRTIRQHPESELLLFQLVRLMGLRASDASMLLWKRFESAGDESSLC